MKEAMVLNALLHPLLSNHHLHLVYILWQYKQPSKLQVVKLDGGLFFTANCLSEPVVHLSDALGKK